ncbi:MAG TPA: class I SAM-dependent methyltransferase [Candidatus Angelobacter sp.]|jgi:ubiquinone/menaquinone biosynthesis C-methylase UbiE|nr:class I SAM-dependent methyltransferase [Candidatus Angelobacter sp.]
MIEDAAQKAEDERVRAAYARRRQTIPAGRYARTNPFTLCAAHEREEEMAAMFRAEGLTTLSGLRILDVGCGRGDTLRQMLEYGADPELLTGIDLLDENVKRARHLSPHLQIICGSASRLPFPDSSFDLVLQFTLFTSILNDEVKRTIAAEMKRVLAPGGRILWYDFSFNNPKNPDVRGIGKREIRTLFPGLEMKVKRVTLAPPLGRIVAPFSIVLYYLLSRIRPLCTHLLCLLRKPKNG